MTGLTVALAFVLLPLFLYVIRYPINSCLDIVTFPPFPLPACTYPIALEFC